jgi:hypothetical protein
MIQWVLQYISEICLSVGIFLFILGQFMYIARTGDFYFFTPIFKKVRYFSRLELLITFSGIVFAIIGFWLF